MPTFPTPTWSKVLNQLERVIGMGFTPYPMSFTWEFDLIMTYPSQHTVAFPLHGGTESFDHSDFWVPREFIMTRPLADTVLTNGYMITAVDQTHPVSEFSCVLGKDGSIKFVSSAEVPPQMTFSALQFKCTLSSVPADSSDDKTYTYQRLIRHAPHSWIDPASLATAALNQDDLGNPLLSEVVSNYEVDTWGNVRFGLHDADSLLLAFMMDSSVATRVQGTGSGVNGFYAAGAFPTKIGVSWGCAALLQRAESYNGASVAMGLDLAITSVQVLDKHWEGLLAQGVEYLAGQGTKWQIRIPSYRYTNAADGIVET